MGFCFYKCKESLGCSITFVQPTQCPSYERLDLSDLVKWSLVGGSVTGLRLQPERVRPGAPGQAWQELPRSDC